jgi:hypothetical protein
MRSSRSILCATLKAFLPCLQSNSCACLAVSFLSQGCLNFGCMIVLMWWRLLKSSWRLAPRVLLSCKWRFSICCYRLLRVWKRRGKCRSHSLWEKEADETNILFGVFAVYLFSQYVFVSSYILLSFWRYCIDFSVSSALSLLLAREETVHFQRV